MSQNKLQAAKELIQEKDYDAARSVLRTLPDDPTAIKWLAQLDRIAPLPAPAPIPAAVPSKPSVSNWPVVLAIIILVAVVGGVGYAIYQDNTRSQEAGQRAADYINEQACTAAYTMYSAAWQNCVDRK